MHDKTALDTRSYRVSSDKIKNKLAFSPARHPKDGAQEVIEALRSGQIVDNIRTRTIDWYKKLMTEDPGILDREF